MSLKIGSVFSGIGALDLGIERSGLGRVRWQVEADEWCRRVLRRHWPQSTIYADVRNLDRSPLPAVDAIIGGFPCQPVSLAGQLKGEDDERWLWPYMAAVLRETGAQLVVLENVPGLIQRGLRTVLRDLTDLGMDADWTVFAACDVGAPHLRRRLFLVAYKPGLLSRSVGWLEAALDSGSVTVQPRPGEGRLEFALRFARENGWPDYCGYQWQNGRKEPTTQRTQARKALGNAVVVACAHAIGRAIVRSTGNRTSWPPTSKPMVMGSMRGGELFGTSRARKFRPSASMLLPTPTVCGDHNRKGASKHSGDGLSTVAGNSIALREYMMGLPLGWANTDGESLSGVRDRYDATYMDQQPKTRQRP